MEPPAIPMSQIDSRLNTGSTWSESQRSRYTEPDLERQEYGDERFPLTYQAQPQFENGNRNPYYTPFEGETGVWGSAQLTRTLTW